MGGGTVRLDVIGPLRAEAGDGELVLGGRRQRTVLALLAARPGEVISVGRLADAVWADASVRRSRTTLQVYVSNLRAVLGRAAIEHREPGYRLDPTVVELDLVRFHSLLAQGRKRAAAGQAGEATVLLRRALDLCRGRLAEDVDGDEVLERDRHALDEQRLGATELTFEQALASGEGADLVADLRRLTGEHPLRERLWGALMLALHRGGRQAEALAAYQAARSALVEQVGVEPGPHLRRLEQVVLLQQETLGTADDDGPSVRWLDPDGADHRLALDEAVALVIGRGDDAQARLAWDAAVSRRHAQVAHLGGRWCVEDLGSRNGTRRNGEVVEGTVTLEDGDVLRLGETTVLVRTGARTLRSTALGTTALLAGPQLR